MATPPSGSGKPPVSITISAASPEPESDSESPKPKVKYRERSAQIANGEKTGVGKDSSSSDSDVSKSSLSDRDTAEIKPSEELVVRRKKHQSQDQRNARGSTTMFAGTFLDKDLDLLPGTSDIEQLQSSDVSSDETPREAQGFKKHATREDISLLIQSLDESGSVDAAEVGCPAILRMASQLKQDTLSFVSVASDVEKALKTDPRWKDMPNKDILLRQIDGVRAFYKDNGLEHLKLVKKAAQRDCNFLVLSKKNSAPLSIGAKSLKVPRAGVSPQKNEATYSFDILRGNLFALLNIGRRWKITWISCAEAAQLTSSKLPDDFVSDIADIPDPKKEKFAQSFNQLSEHYRHVEEIIELTKQFEQLGAKSANRKAQQHLSGHLEPEQKTESEPNRDKPSLDRLLGSVSASSMHMAALPTDYYYSFGLKMKQGGKVSQAYVDLLEKISTDAQQIKMHAKTLLKALSRGSATYEDFQFKSHPSLDDAAKLIERAQLLEKRWQKTTPSMQDIYTQIT